MNQNILKIKQFRYSADNFSYLIYSGIPNSASALAVDCGAVDSILKFVKSENITLKWITNTHNHHDHTSGNLRLLEISGAQYLDIQTLIKLRSIEIDGQTIQIFHTPGHTEDSICFYFSKILITGDTLFNGTVGNCFSGNLNAFYHSIKMIMELPKETIVYAGHDYIRDSMAFARMIEPENKDIDWFLENYDPEHVFSTLESEMKINPYLRFNEQSIINLLRNKGLSTKTEIERWNSLMSI